uniref:Tetraspanin n=1 Tax=Knipowitschia caucasica TaxID=637954 RepID=A0AAV2MIX6_KNICA
MKNLLPCARCWERGGVCPVPACPSPAPGPAPGPGPGPACGYLSSRAEIIFGTIFSSLFEDKSRMGVYEEKKETCGTICLKYLLITFNFLFWLAGGVVMAVGIWTLLEKSDYISLLPSKTYAASAYILVLAGAIVMVTGVLGCCATFKEQRRLLRVYFVLLLCIFLLEVLAGVLAYIYYQQLNEELKLSLRDTMIQKYQKSNQEHVTRAVDKLQQERLLRHVLSLTAPPQACPQCHSASSGMSSVSQRLLRHVLSLTAPPQACPQCHSASSGMSSVSQRLLRHVLSLTAPPQACPQSHSASSGMSSVSQRLLRHVLSVTAPPQACPQSHSASSGMSSVSQRLLRHVLSVTAPPQACPQCHSASSGMSSVSQRLLRHVLSLTAPPQACPQCHSASSGMSSVSQRLLRHVLSLTAPPQACPQSHSASSGMSSVSQRLLRHFKCCGSNSSSDWAASEWIRSQAGQGRLVPDSCCKTPTPMCGERDHPSNIYKVEGGCITKLERFILEHLKIIGAVGVGIACVQVIGMVFTCCLYKSLKVEPY